MELLRLEFALAPAVWVETVKDASNDNISSPIGAWKEYNVQSTANTSMGNTMNKRERTQDKEPASEYRHPHIQFFFSIRIEVWKRQLSNKGRE